MTLILTIETLKSLIEHLPEDYTVEYKNKEGIVSPLSDIVEIDEKKLSQMNIKIIKSRLVSYNNVGEVRHNAKKVAATIFSLLLDIEEQREG